MAVIKLLTGTTADYKETEHVLILDDREIAVEIVSDESSGKKYFNIRQGDGKSTFFDLPIIVNNERFEKINEIIAGYYDEIQQFSQSMTQSAALANQAAQKADQAAKAAEAVVENVQHLEEGLNSIIDDTTQVEYVLGIESGLLYMKDADE